MPIDHILLGDYQLLALERATADFHFSRLPKWRVGSSAIGIAKYSACSPSTFQQSSHTFTVKRNSCPTSRFAAALMHHQNVGVKLIAKPLWL
jgi:hypothetical protein